MRVPAGQAIRETNDDDGHRVFTVKVETTAFGAKKVTEQAAVDRLKASLGGPFTVSRTEPVFDTTGLLVAYSIWIER